MSQKVEPSLENSVGLTHDASPVENATRPSSPTGKAYPITVYSSQSELRNLFGLLKSIFRGFIDGRELAWRIFVRNLNGLYRQTLLGLFWAFLPPLANTAIWIFLKSQNVFEMGDTGVDSTVYILTGMIPVSYTHLTLPTKA